MVSKYLRIHHLLMVFVLFNTPRLILKRNHHHLYYYNHPIIIILTVYFFIQAFLNNNYNQIIKFLNKIQSISCPINWLLLLFSPFFFLFLFPRLILYLLLLILFYKSWREKTYFLFIILLITIPSAVFISCYSLELFAFDQSKELGRRGCGRAVSVIGEDCYREWGWH